MFGDNAQSGAVRIGFVLVPDFSMIAFAAGVEPLRIANRLSESPLFAGAVLSVDGAPVRASNGVELAVDGAFTEAGPLDMVLVCAGLNVRNYISPELSNALRRRAAHGAAVGALCTGSHILAEAGLLDGYRCTIHWENLLAFSEAFPHLDVTAELYEIDRDRLTCAGGTAAADMMLTMIAVQSGGTLSAMAADHMIHHRIREGNESQRMELQSRIGVAHPKLLSVITMMEDNLEEPLACAELARRAKLSPRQLERLFQKHLHQAPTRYYLQLRLNRARFLLTQSSMPILNVALSCGFVSASHFSKCYRERFQRRPSEERRMLMRIA
ncbi:MAG: GlxA family transcriptional regulator [Rhodospirillales bacterium]